jgi:hypothetical protein
MTHPHSGSQAGEREVSSKVIPFPPFLIMEYNVPTPMEIQPMRTILQSLDTLSGVLLSPSRTFESITGKRPFALALLTAISVAIVSGLVIAPNPPELAEVMFDLRKGTLSLWAILPLWVCLFLAVLCVQVTFVHVTAIVLRGKGCYSGILCGLCFAYLPGLLAAPLVVLRAVFSSDRANAFYGVVFPLLCLWIFLLAIAAVQRNYGMTTLRAVSICSLAFAVLVVSPMVVAVIVMTRVMT